MMMDEEFVKKLAQEMIERKAAENAVVIADPEEIDSLYFECVSWNSGKPYYQDFGQFCGGVTTERFIHPFSNGDRHVQFTQWVDEEGNDVTECVEWTKFKDFSYPL